MVQLPCHYSTDPASSCQKPKRKHTKCVNLLPKITTRKTNNTAYHIKLEILQDNKTKLISCQTPVKAARIRPQPASLLILITFLH